MMSVDSSTCSRNYAYDCCPERVCACAYTIAFLQALIQDKSSSARAHIASRKVCTVLFTSTIVRETFIDICNSKVLLVAIQS